MNQKRAINERFIEKDLHDSVAAELSTGALALKSGLARQLEAVKARILWSALVVFVFAGLGVMASRSTASEVAQSADGFVDTIGVNTHLKFTSGSGNPYGNAQVLTLLGQLGIRNIRDDMPVGSSFYSRLTSLYNTNGIRVCWCPYTWDRTAPSIPAIVTTLKTNAFVRYLEGPNEPDINVRAGYVNYFYNGCTNNLTNNIYVATQSWQTNIYAAVKADAVASNTPVTSAAMGFSINAQYMNPIPLDYEAMHSYPGGNVPTYKLDVYNISNANLMATTPQPLLATETGYHTAVNDTNIVADGPFITQRAQAKYLPRLFAEYFNRGIVNTYTYEFMNEFNDPTFTNKQANFGIVNYNFSPNLAFTNLQNLITLLKEAGWNTGSKTWNVPEFTPSALGFTLSGGTNNVHHTLLQKSTGEFYLLLWQDVSAYYNSGGYGNIANWKDLTNASVAVTLTLTTPISNAATYMLGSLTLTASYTNPSSLSLSVPDEIMVVRLMPNPPLADFSGSPVSGFVPLTVSFADSSTGLITNRFWDFGDGSSTNPTTLNVSHVYTNAGIYTVSLVVSGSNGSSTNTRVNYVVASLQPLAQWTFSAGAATDLISDAGGYTFAVAGAGTPTYHAGSISLPSNAELVAAGINSTNLPNLTNTATVWARMKFDAVPNPALTALFFLGLMNATAPADYTQATLVAEYKTNSVINGGTGGTPITLRGRVITNGVTIPYEQNFAAFPGTNVYFTVAVTLATGQDANGNPNPGKTRFQLFINGSLVGSGSQGGPNVIPVLALCLGELKASGGVAVTFDEVRVWDQTLTTNQIAQLEGPLANPDVATTTWNVPLMVSPLINDADPNFLPLTVVGVSATNATASIIGGTNVLVTPTLGSNRTAYIAYTITNSNGGDASSLITVTVLTPPRPVVKMAALSGSALVLSGTNGAANGIYQLLSTTNLGLPLANWMPILTNTFDAGGRFSVTNQIDPASPVKFLLIKQ